MPDTALINRIVALNKANGIGRYDAMMATWKEALLSDSEPVRFWLSQNRNTIENLLSVRPIDTDDAAFFRTHLFGIEEPKSHPVFVCALPKSGSTSFSRLLAASLGKSGASAHNRNSPDHALDIDRLRAPITKGNVVHSHLLPSADVLSLLNVLGITPIVLLRNIPDALSSRWRHEQGSTLHNLYALPRDLESAPYQFAYGTLRFASMWLQACERFDWPVFYFEDNVADWSAAITRAAATIGEMVDPENLATVLRSYEHAIVDRPGEFRISTEPKTKLPQHQVDAISALAEKFGGPDLSRLLAF